MSDNYCTNLSSRKIASDNYCTNISCRKIACVLPRRPRPPKLATRSSQLDDASERERSDSHKNEWDEGRKGKVKRDLKIIKKEILTHSFGRKK